MHTVRLSSKEGLWQVVHYDPCNREWYVIIDYKEEDDAWRVVNYLNGGPRKLPKRRRSE
jgi:hypothetical protein